MQCRRSGGFDVLIGRAVSLGPPLALVLAVSLGLTACSHFGRPSAGEERPNAASSDAPPPPAEAPSRAAAPSQPAPKGSKPKNQVDDLLSAVRAFHNRRPGKTLAQLRQQYDVLLLKVLSLLQDGDPSLAAAIFASREALRGILADPQKFSKI